MRHFVFLFISSLIGKIVSAQLGYTLTYKDSSSSTVKISIQPATPVASAASFVMPRSVPGGYSIYIYDKFLEDFPVVPLGRRMGRPEEMAAAFAKAENALSKFQIFRTAMTLPAGSKTSSALASTKT